MPHLTDHLYPKRTGSATIGIYRRALQLLPVTLAVVLGPLIAVVYRQTQPIDAPTGSLSAGQVIRGLFWVLMLLSLVFSRRLHLLAHRLVRPLLFLAAYAVVTAFIRPYPYQQLVFAVKMAFLTVVFVSALHLAKEGHIRERWLTTCAWLVLLITATCISIGLITGRTADRYKTRYATAGLMNHVGTTSAFALSTLPVFLRGIATSPSALAGVAILYASLFFTMRRSALIAAAVATACSFLIYLSPFEGRIPWRRTLGMLAVLLVLLGIGLNTPAGADLMARFRELKPSEGTGSGRYIFWRISLEHVLDRAIHAQLWGEGVGCIRDLMKERYGLAIPSHNDALDLVNAFGWCGLIGIGWWYCELARFARRLYRRHDGLFQGACASVIILGLISLGTGGSFEPPWAFSYAAMGFWAGRAAEASPRCWMRDEEPIRET
jgi:hypothetical protein